MGTRSHSLDKVILPNDRNLLDNREIIMLMGLLIMRLVRSVTALDIIIPAQSGLTIG